MSAIGSGARAAFGPDIVSCPSRTHTVTTIERYCADYVTVFVVRVAWLALVIISTTRL